MGNGCEVQTRITRAGCYEHISCALGLAEVLNARCANGFRASAIEPVPTAFLFDTVVVQPSLQTVVKFEELREDGDLLRG
jgi:hypothetical protein